MVGGIIIEPMVLRKADRVSTPHLKTYGFFFWVVCLDLSESVVCESFLDLSFCELIFGGLGGVDGITPGSTCFLLLLLDGNFELDFFFGLIVSPKLSTKGTTSMSAYSTSPMYFLVLVGCGEFWTGTTSITFLFCPLLDESC